MMSGGLLANSARKSSYALASCGTSAQRSSHPFRYAWPARDERRYLSVDVPRDQRASVRWSARNKVGTLFIQCADTGLLRAADAVHPAIERHAPPRGGVPRK